MKEKEIDIVKETEKEHRHVANRSELRGTTMCKKHRFIKNSDTEVACQQCPTALTVENADKFLKEY